VFTRAPTRHYYRNQSILIDNTGRILATYEKTYPVILGEAYVSIAGAGKLPVADTPYGRMATAICNDFHFPALAPSTVGTAMCTSIRSPTAARILPPVRPPTPAVPTTRSMPTARDAVTRRSLTVITLTIW
jgi:predicted amidohydrolase